MLDGLGKALKFFGWNFLLLGLLVVGVLFGIILPMEDRLDAKNLHNSTSGAAETISVGIPNRFAISAAGFDSLMRDAARTDLTREKFYAAHDFLSEMIQVCMCDLEPLPSALLIQTEVLPRLQRLSLERDIRGKPADSLERLYRMCANRLALAVRADKYRLRWPSDYGGNE